MNLSDLTAEKVKELESGFDVDLLVAEAVMLCSWQGNPLGNMEFLNPRGMLYAKRERSKVIAIGYQKPNLPAYSMDIAAAYAMETEIQRQGWHQQYALKLDQFFKGSFYLDHPFMLAHASPMNRCKAALLAWLEKNQ